MVLHSIAYMRGNIHLCSLLKRRKKNFPRMDIPAALWLRWNNKAKVREKTSQLYACPLGAGARMYDTEPTNYASEVFVSAHPDPNNSERFSARNACLNT